MVSFVEYFNKNPTKREWGSNMKTAELIASFVKKYKLEQFADLFEAEIQPADLQWILMELVNLAVKRISPPLLLNRNRTSRFTRACDVSPIDFLRLEVALFERAASNYKAVELAPVTSFGANAVLAKISQGNVLSTVRTLEVTADTTMALTLEAVSLIKDSGEKARVSLCSAQRCLRLQGATDDYGFTPHFKIFALASVFFRERKELSPVYDELVRQISVYLDILTKCKGVEIGHICVELSDIGVIESLIEQSGSLRQEVCSRINDPEFSLFEFLGKGLASKVASCADMAERDYSQFLALERQVLKPLQESYRQVEFLLDLGRVAGLGYYNGPCFKIYATDASGKKYPLADGGVSDWAAKLLSDNRWQVCTSGFGSELLCRNFKK